MKHSSVRPNKKAAQYDSIIDQAKNHQMLEQGIHGFEWEFELDGVLNDYHVVSIARQYCAGEMPKM
eukprot:15366203-Ditylum_brightwellii.AAC.1